MLSLNLVPLNIDNSTAGWVGFTASLTANVLGVLVGRIATTRAVQSFGWSRLVVLINIIATIAILYFTLLVEGLLPWRGSASYMQAFVSATIANVGSAAVPLYYELAIEATHPLPEATVVTVLTLMNNIGELSCVDASSYVLARNIYTHIRATHRARRSAGCGIILVIPIADAGSIFNWAVSDSPSHGCVHFDVPRRCVTAPVHIFTALHESFPDDTRHSILESLPPARCL